jgi:hypothetical protein
MVNLPERSERIKVRLMVFNRLGKDCRDRQFKASNRIT